MSLSLIPKCNCEENPLYRLVPGSREPWRAILWGKLQGNSLWLERGFRDGAVCPECGMELTPTCRCGLWKWRDGAWRTPCDPAESPCPIPYDTRCCMTRLLPNGEVALMDMRGNIATREAEPEPFRCSCYRRDSDGPRRYWERMSRSQPHCLNWILFEEGAGLRVRSALAAARDDVRRCDTCGDLLTANGAVGCRP